MFYLRLQNELLSPDCYTSNKKRNTSTYLCINYYIILYNKNNLYAKSREY